MYYVSTRDAGRRLTASQAIVEGLSRDGGLYLPEEIPQLTMDEIKALAALSYPERAARLMKRYLDEFTEEELDYCVNGNVETEINAALSNSLGFGGHNATICMKKITD